MDKNQAYEYSNRINRVCDYTDGHLKEDMTLEKLAGAAGFSQYHFQKDIRRDDGRNAGRQFERQYLRTGRSDEE